MIDNTGTPFNAVADGNTLACPNGASHGDADAQGDPSGDEHPIADSDGVSHAHPNAHACSDADPA